MRKVNNPQITNWQGIHRQASQDKSLRALRWTCCKLEKGDYNKDFARNSYEGKLGLCAKDLKIITDHPPTKDLQELRAQLASCRNEANKLSQQNRDDHYAIILTSSDKSFGATMYELDSVWKRGRKIRSLQWGKKERKLQPQRMWLANQFTTKGSENAYI